MGLKKINPLLAPAATHKHRKHKKMKQATFKNIPNQQTVATMQVQNAIQDNSMV